MANYVNVTTAPDLGNLLLSAARISDRELLRRLGISTWQYYCQWVFVLVMVTLFGGILPVSGVAKLVGHQPIIPIWKDPVCGPIVMALCVVLYAALFAFMILWRRRYFLAVYEHGFLVGRKSFAFKDICEVQLGRKDGTIASAIVKLNAAIPFAQNQGVVRLLDNSSVLSMTLVMSDGRVMSLPNFFACYPSDALEAVVCQLEAKVLKSAVASAGGEG